MKTCSKCKLELAEERFGKNAAYKDGLQIKCKSCLKISAETRKEQKAIYDKAYEATHKEEKIAYTKAYNKTHKKEKAAHNKAYNKTHKEEVAAYGKEYTRKRRQTDSQFKIACNLRTRLWCAIKDQNSTKTGSAIKDLDCSTEELKKYLESKFYSNPKTGEVMDWSNYGLYGWHVDHIRPLSDFNLTDPEQLKEACNYKNLQPLWAEDNLSKSDKWNNE